MFTALHGSFLLNMGRKCIRVCMLGGKYWLILETGYHSYFLALLLPVAIDCRNGVPKV